MRHAQIAGWFVLGLALMLGGCVKLQYRSITPSMRSFSDDPWVDDMYFGADAEFAVLDRRQERYLASAALPSRHDTLDAWNPPIALDKITTPHEFRMESAETGEQVEIDAAPAIPAFEDWGRLGL